MIMSEREMSIRINPNPRKRGFGYGNISASLDAPRGQTGKAGLSATLSLNKVAVANYCQSAVRPNEIVEEAQ